MKNIKIIHLLHADGPGGIEVGAKLGEQELKKYINYEIKYIFNSEDKVITRLVKSIKVTRLLLKESSSREKKIILSSLWMSHIIAFILKILLKNITWFSFLHTSNYHNIINYLVCTKLTRLADKQIFDSYSTAKAYNNKKNNRQEIVNFFFPNYELKKFDINNWANRKYDFIIVARNEKRKGVLEIENFFLNTCHSYKSKPKIIIITDNLNKAVDFMELKRKLSSICDIELKTNITNPEVLKYLAESKIYVCLSHYEGFAMSVVESLLSGCFIVTTNVGEQQYYLHPNRRLVLNNSSNYNLDFNYINKNGSSEENFVKAKEFLHKNIKSYSDSLKRIVMENK